MRDSGILYYNGNKYVFALDQNVIMLYPCDPEEGLGLFGIHEREKYKLELVGNPGVRGFVWKHTALISTTNTLQHGEYKLTAEYVFSRWDGNGIISGMDIYGEAVDDLMALLNNQSQLFGEGTHLHSKKEKVFSSWDLTYRGEEIRVQMLIANVQNYKGRSIFEFHPVLRVYVPGAENTDKLFAIYKGLLNAIRIMRYRFPAGDINVKLWDMNDTPRKVGVMTDGVQEKADFIRRYSIAPIQFWTPYMKRLFQFCLNDDSLQLDWFPYEAQRYCPEDYDPHFFSLLFTAFEHECHRESEIYESVSTEAIDGIRELVLSDLENIKGKTKTVEELGFVEKAINSIAKLDTQIGQKKKLLRAYEYVCEGISEFINYTLLSMDKCYKADEILSHIPVLRGKIVHEGGTYHFTDVDARAAKMLELIVYAQMLRRAGMEFDEIKKIIEFVFEYAGGNYTFVVPDE